MIKFEKELLIATDTQGKTRIFAPSGSGSAKSHGRDSNYTIIKNVPTTGFKIVSKFDELSLTMRRDTIQVLDPRGFVIDCNSASIIALIQEATIIDGYIMDECIWGRSTIVPILIKTNSEIFNNITTEKEILDIQNIPVGSICTFKNGKKYYYHGKAGLIFTPKIYSLKNSIVEVLDDTFMFSPLTKSATPTLEHRYDFIPEPNIISYESGKEITFFPNISLGTIKYDKRILYTERVQLLTKNISYKIDTVMVDAPLKALETNVLITSKDTGFSRLVLSSSMYAVYLLGSSKDISAKSIDEYLHKECNRTSVYYDASFYVNSKKYLKTYQVVSILNSSGGVIDTWK